jgi:hypothetical protein
MNSLLVSANSCLNWQRARGKTLKETMDEESEERHSG